MLVSRYLRTPRLRPIATFPHGPQQETTPRAAHEPDGIWRQYETPSDATNCRRGFTLGMLTSVAAKAADNRATMSGFGSRPVETSREAKERRIVLFLICRLPTELPVQLVSRIGDTATDVLHAKLNDRLFFHNSRGQTSGSRATQKTRLPLFPQQQTTPEFFGCDVPKRCLAQLPATIARQLGKRKKRPPT